MHVVKKALLSNLQEGGSPLSEPLSVPLQHLGSLPRYFADFRDRSGAGSGVGIKTKK